LERPDPRVAKREFSIDKVREENFEAPSEITEALRTIWIDEVSFSVTCNAPTEAEASLELKRLG
jgi:hypothetical protein